MMGDDAGCIRGEADTGRTGAVKGCGGKQSGGEKTNHNKRKSCSTFCHSATDEIGFKMGLRTGFMSGLIPGDWLPLNSNDAYEVT